MFHEWNQLRSGRSSPAVLSVALYLSLSAALLTAILVQTQGHFTYCLDDPYIHLALAERIRHGLYGLNAGEPASPSSSIVWPLLFVPFAGTAIMAWLPLILNVLCGALTAFLLGNMMREILQSGGEERLHRGNGLRAPWLAVLLVIALNLPGLTFTGLEHSLQVLLCVCCATGAVRAMHGERAPASAIAAAIILPSVRYEGLLIAAGFAVVLLGRRAWRTALTIIAASALVPAGFSLLLHRLGLPWFPLSVLVKSSYKFQDKSSLAMGAARLIWQTLKQSLFDVERLPQLLITALLVALAWKHRRTRSLRYALAGAALVGAVQVVLGPVGWFYRYEIYALAFTLPLLIATVELPRMERMTESDLGTRSRGALDVTSPTLQAGQQHAPVVSVPLLVGVGALALIYCKPLLSVPRAALGIYEQQYQLGRLMGEFYQGNVAVNDLGWVSFRRTPNHYTLDLYGLGSYEAFRTKERERTPQWLDAITREHNVGLVAIYPEWFTQGVPRLWTPVAKLCAQDVDTSLGPVSRRVMIYGTALTNPERLQAALDVWRPGLPAGSTMQTGDAVLRDSCR